MSSPTTPSTPRTWSKTPPQSPRALCEKTFPTPSDAAKIVAEERRQRTELLKAKRAESALQAMAANAARQELLEVAPPTPASLAQPGTPQETTGTNAQENSTSAPTDHATHKQTKTKKLRSATGLKKRTPKNRDEIETTNRYEVLGQETEKEGPGPTAAEQEASQEPPNPDLSASQPRLPREKKRPRRSGALEGTTVGNLASEPSTPTPKSKTIGSPYDSNYSHHTMLREKTRSERRASQQGVARNDEIEDLERWLHSGGIEALDQITRQEENRLGLTTEGGLVDHNGDQIMLQGENEDAHPNAPEAFPPFPHQTDPFLANYPAHAPPPQEARKDVAQVPYVRSPPTPLITTQPTSSNAHPPREVTHHTMTVSPTEGDPRPSQNVRTHQTGPRDYHAPNLTQPDLPVMTTDVAMHIPSPPLSSTAQPNHYIHKPTTHKIADLKFSAPSANFQIPRGNDPFYHFDNLSKEQTKEWPNSPGRSILVRLAGKGYPAANKEQARKDEILSLLCRTVGLPRGVRITAPSAATPESGLNKPPFNFLMYNLDEDYLNRLRSLGGCISTTEGTLFFATNGPVIDTLIGTIEGFDDEADEDQLRILVNRAFNDSDLNSTIATLAKTNEQLALLPPEIATDMICRSLSITIVGTKRQDNTVFRVAHLFLDSPTLNPLDWRTFRDKAMNSNFKDPFLGMNIRPIKCWICGVCSSTLHTKQSCPILTEPGWLYNPSINPPPTTTAHPNASQIPATTFTTIGSGNRSGSERGGHGGGKGPRGGNRGGCGRGRGA
ncbi:hypothetical protein BC835DRAFT_1422659 [Cytidiella melzeri]|nr:hypothetical protein BC835DRAFT_1422659 [Cytidiella melzeri]